MIQKLKAFLWRWTKSVQKSPVIIPPIIVAHVPPSWWTENPEEQGRLRLLLQDDVMKRAVSTLHARTPRVLASDVRQTDPSYELGRVNGYREAIETLIALPHITQFNPQPIEADYGANTDTD